MKHDTNEQCNTHSALTPSDLPRPTLEGWKAELTYRFNGFIRLHIETVYSVTQSHRRSPIQELTHQRTAGSRTSDLSITSPRSLLGLRHQAIIYAWSMVSRLLLHCYLLFSMPIILVNKGYCLSLS